MPILRINLTCSLHPLRPLLHLVALVFLFTNNYSAAAETGRLFVSVIDAATKRELPVRLRLQASDGAFPGDRLASAIDRWPNVGAHGVFFNGHAEFELPPGDTLLTAGHGPQYDVATQKVRVTAGETTKVQLKLTRQFDLRARGWVGGDAHVHMIHGEMQRETSYEDVATTCAGNGLDFVSVGQEYVGAGKLDLAGYHAACAKVSTKDFRMLLGGERPKSILGHQVILGVNDPFIVAEDPPYYEAARALHAQGGVSFFVHPVRYYPGKQYGGKWLDMPGNNLARELIFDAFCGPSFDGLSVLSDEPANSVAHALWFNLLNRGLFVPALSDSDACFDRPTLGLGAPGFWNSYFYLGPDAEITGEALAEAVRRGRTVASTGPLVEFMIDEERSGATLPIDGQSRTVTIEAFHGHHVMSLATSDAKSGETVGLKRIELIRNGKVVETWSPMSAGARYEHKIAETQDCWYAVRVFGTDERWQVALASPIYFANKPIPQKRPPTSSVVRGRIYDFTSGESESATVTIRRGTTVLKTFMAEGQFRVRMPLDAEIVVQAPGRTAISRNLLLDYAPVHRFLWYLESKDFGKPETLDQFERLVREVDLEFPLGFKLPGCYVERDLEGPTKFESVKIIEDKVDGPAEVSDGKVSVAAILLDSAEIGPGDTIEAAAIFRSEGNPAGLGPLVVEARGYDPARPTGFGALKKFAEFEKRWDTAADLGSGYKLISGKLTLPKWATADTGEGGRADGYVDISVRARLGSQDASFIGLQVPIGKTRRALCVLSPWPTMPASWPDGNYGIGPLKITGRAGREAQPRADYRRLHFEATTSRGKFDLWPARDAHGCADSDDALYTARFVDQTLSDESHLAQPDPIRPQPTITWRLNLPVHDATQ